MHCWVPHTTLSKQGLGLQRQAPGLLPSHRVSWLVLRSAATSHGEAGQGTVSAVNPGVALGQVRGAGDKSQNQPWMVWLSRWGVGLQTKGSPVQFPVRAHAWVAGQVPTWGRVRGSQMTFLLHIDVSLPLFLPPFPSLKINKIFKKIKK